MRLLTALRVVMVTQRPLTSETQRMTQPVQTSRRRRLVVVLKTSPRRQYSPQRVPAEYLRDSQSGGSISRGRCHGDESGEESDLDHDDCCVW